MKKNLDRRVLALLMLILLAAVLDKAPIIEPEPIWKDIIVAIGVATALGLTLWKLGDSPITAMTFGILYFLFSQKLDDINPLPKFPEETHKDLLFVALFLILYLVFTIAYQVLREDQKS
jgi:hypothetical protein